MSGETVHNTRVLLSELQEVRVDLISIEILHPLLFGSLVAHADPDVGVQHVCRVRGFLWFADDLDFGTGRSRYILSLFENRLVRLVALRTCDSHSHPFDRRAEQK